MATWTGPTRFPAAATAAIALALGAPHAVAQGAPEPTPSIYSWPPPPWGQMDRALETTLAAACAGPEASIVIMHGRTVFNGVRNSIRRVSASPNGALAIYLTGDSMNAQTLVYADGVDKPARRLVTGDKVALSTDGRALAWLDDAGVEVTDLLTDRRTLIRRPDCETNESPRWIGQDLMVECEGPDVEVQVFERAADGFRLGSSFNLPDGASDEAIGRLAIVDESGTRFLRGERVYPSVATVVADHGMPAFPASVGEQIYRIGDRLLQIEGNEPGDEGAPTLVARDANAGATEQRLTLPSARCRVRDVAVAPDGRTFALLLDRSVVQVFDAADLSTKAVYSLRRSGWDPAEWLAVLPDGRLVSGSDASVQVHDLARASP
jgi:hypothetical protein